MFGFSALGGGKAGSDWGWMMLWPIVMMIRALIPVVARFFGARGLAYVSALYVARESWDIYGHESYVHVRDKLYGWVSFWAVKSLGLRLDSSDPFSDASLCNALGEKTGIALRTVKDKESVRQDVEHWALAKLEEQTGLHIRNIRDKKGVVRDVMRFASPVVADATGLPLTDISDAEKMRAEVTNHLRDRALVLLSHDIERVKVLVREALGAMGTTLDQLAADIVRKGGIDPVTGLPNVKVDATMIALGVLARALIAADKRRREEEAERQRGSRRQEQQRAALKRFREKHGSRMRYERIGG